MSYRIEYIDGKHSDYAKDRSSLLNIIKDIRADQISDIRKIYKSGVSDSVIEKYQNYIRKN